MSPTSRVRFGIMTAPQQVTYDDMLRVWREADAIPQIEHAWLFDHLFPIAGDKAGPIFEGWTLLSAMAAQTQRLRVGLLVTSNRFRPPETMSTGIIFGSPERSATPNRCNGRTPRS